MKKTVKNFNFSTFSFQGNSLIEASAGTGKTYVISMLYLRLLLGIHNHPLPALTIEKILLVTFTNIAAEELRIRIYNNIREFRLACIAGYSSNVFFSEILDKINDMSLVYRQLLEAERNVGLMQVFTIHGFCQRILDMCPIELNSVFRYKILNDETLVFKKACNDFWRHYFYPLPIEITSIIDKYWSGPENLFKDISPYLYNMSINIRPIIKETDIIKQHKNIINYINYVKSIWNDKRGNLLDLIDSLLLNRRVYNTKNLRIWLDKIDCWANKITRNYKIPNELKRFRYSEIINNNNSQTSHVLEYSLFEIIEILFQKIFSLKQLIFNIAIHEIRKIVKDVKNESLEVSFNDLIYFLDDALHHPDKSEKLAQVILECYPIAIIDEFQDTDFHQYRIFHKLYSYSSQYGLLLIGDPKQSIYSFRGADIFSYLLARKNVSYHYTLDTNWRSSKSMINSINILFQFNSSFPFVFQNIPFIPMNVAKNNKKLCLTVNGELYPALHFWLPSCKKISLCKYQSVMAYQCAHTILDLLNGAHRNSVWLHNNSSKRLLQESDIVILVRDRNEACLISSVLKKFNVDTIYVSNKENIFKTKEASDLLLVLQAVLTPENDNLLRCAFMTEIIGYDAKKIDSINQNEKEWKKEVEEFTDYYFLWKKNGLKFMLQEIIFRRYALKIVSCMEEREQCLINILHLGEILQKKSMEFYNDNSLVSWLNTQINSNVELYSDDQLSKSQQFNSRLIRIITIHKAKGLEFPLVFLPFIPVLYMKKYPLFHNRGNYQMYLDLDGDLKNFNLSEEERLSEDLRLFYVAITRAIYYCFIGIGSVFFKKSNIKNYSDLHRTALGHLIQNGIPGDFEFLTKCLKKLSDQANGDIVFNFIINDGEYHRLLIDQLKISNDNDILKKKSLSARDWKVSIKNFHKVTSYTELNRFVSEDSTFGENLKFKDIINLKNNGIEKCGCNLSLLTPHTFPRGSIFGNFLHCILQKWNFQEKIDNTWLMTELTQNSIDLMWLPVVEKWINMVVHAPLDKKDLMLSELSFVNCSSELQFYLSVGNLISAEEFDKICKDHDSISRLSSKLKFPDIIGMVHGFIDLVFFWKGKYYLLDYKSNWLGETCNHYDCSALKHEMIVQHYALQYQIYTLALHRFLRHKIIQYDYEKDFGGVYYLFLRGIDLSYPGYGIYYCRPKKLLIDKLDKLLLFSHTGM